MLTLNLSGFTPEEALELIYIGLEQRREVITLKIAELRGQLVAQARLRPGKTSGPAKTSGSRWPGTPPETAPAKAARAPSTKRPMSKEARERIALAQKKRWGKYHREKKAQLRDKPALAAKKQRRAPVQPEPDQAEANFGE